jgi:integrase
MQAEGRDTERGKVFCDTAGGYLRQSNFRRNSFAPALKRAGLAHLPIRPYDMRHTSATLLLAAGVNIKVVSQRLGHESIVVTLKHYIHVLPDMQEHARAVVIDLFGDCPTVVPQEGSTGTSSSTQTKAG